jgi:hypothetical protein
MSRNNPISAVALFCRGKKNYGDLSVSYVIPSPLWDTFLLVIFSSTAVSPLPLCNLEVVVQLHLAVHPLTHSTTLSETVPQASNPINSYRDWNNGLYGKQHNPTPFLPK